MTVRLPSPQDAKKEFELGSKAAASGPSQMAGVAMTLPESASTTAETLSSQTASRRRVLRSAARPEGDLHGASGQRWVSFRFCESSATRFGVSSALTKMAPLPSDTANSGLSPSGIEPTTEPSVALMTVEFLPRPLKVKTRLVAGS